VVFDPSTEILYHAIKGQGAFKNEKQWNPDLSLENKSSFTLQIDRTFLNHRFYKHFIEGIKELLEPYGIIELIMSVDKVLETMQTAGKPMKAGEIAEASGLDKKEVDKAMKVLKKEERIVSPKYCYWEPK
jgi:hypothetical protein